MQLSLFAPQFDSKIRRTHHNEETVYSIVDIMAHFTSTKRARKYWNDTKDRLEKEGFQLSAKIGQLKLMASDGKFYETDVANVRNAFRILMSIPTPKDPKKRALLEEIKQWLANQGGDVVDAHAALTRKKHIDLYEQAGYGNHPEILRLKDRDTNIAVFKSLKETIKKICDNPRWSEIVNAEYLALFDMIASELKSILNTQDIRENLPSVQLVWLTAAERTLQDVLKDQQALNNEEIITIIDITIAPIGDMLQRISRQRGIHHVTGKPLLPSQTNTI